MTNTFNHNQTSQRLMGLFSGFFPVQASSTARRGRRHVVSVPVKERSSTAATRGCQTTRLPLQQQICHALVVVAMASALGGLLAAYNLSDSIQAQAGQWVKVVKG